MEFRFELPAKFGVGRSKFGTPGDMYPEIKGQWLNYYFFENGERRNYLFFLTCHIMISSCTVVNESRHVRHKSAFRSMVYYNLKVLNTARMLERIPVSSSKMF